MYLSIKRGEFEKLEEIIINVFSEREDEINFYHIIDLLCNDYDCPIGNSKASYYFDDDHLSEQGAKIISPKIEKIFNE